MKGKITFPELDAGIPIRPKTVISDLPKPQYKKINQRQAQIHKGKGKISHTYHQRSR